MWTIKGDPILYNLPPDTQEAIRYDPLLDNAIETHRRDRREILDRVDVLEHEIKQIQKDLRIAFGLCALLALTGLLGLI